MSTAAVIGAGVVKVCMSVPLSVRSRWLDAITMRPRAVTGLASSCHGR
jgi:hypothetical protein